MNIYWAIVFAVILFGMIMPQEGRRRIYYVVLMAGIHIFICAFRYQFLTGDLIKYNTEFRKMQTFGYFSEECLNGWKNTGFYWLMKLIGGLTNGNYQMFLIVLAVFTGVVVAVLIYRYSPRPWLSFLVWNCMAFYVTYDMLAIKQGLAMAVLMLALMCIFEKKPVGFLICTLLAGFIHMPALAFLPAYFLANRKVNGGMILVYCIAAAVIYALRPPIVDAISEVYYEDSFELVSAELGGRVFVIVLILLAGFALKGFQEKRFSQLFHLVVVAAILQMFSGFDNVFTRLADYYLQMTVLFIPMIFYDSDHAEMDYRAMPAILPFNTRSKKLLVAVLTLVLMWWYYTTCLGHTISYEVDNFLNFRFMWQVK